MPADFDRCVNEGGDVWTETSDDGKQYRRMCRDKKGEVHPGHWETKKEEKESD